MRFIVFILLFSCVFISCKQQNVTSHFNETYSNLDITYKIISNEDSTSRIVYTFNTAELIQINSKNNKSFYYFTIENYDENKNEIIHSYSTKVITNVLNPQNSFTISDFDYPYNFPHNSSVRIQMRNSTGLLLNTQTFYIESEENKFEIFIYQNKDKYDWTQLYVVKGTFLFINNSFIDDSKIFVAYNSTNSAGLILDTVVINSKSFQYTFSLLGNYSFYSDSSLENMIFKTVCVSNNYPLNNSPCEMLDALSIIETNSKVDSIKSNTVGCKIELDKYWLKLCKGDEICAKNLIKEYYNRVATANKRYTYGKQGMFSDRGKCLILFGEPITILFSKNQEIWKYSKEVDNSDKVFIFTKSNNKFSDYILQDVESKKVFFEHAKLNWKSGNIYKL